NAFNSIATLVRTRPGEAESVVEDLSDLFRYALRASKKDAATLGEEVQAARRYLAVEKARFQDRLTVEIDVPERLCSVSLPSMTLQPLVENAVKHGVGRTQDGCTVTVTAEQNDGTLVLHVTDTGPGFETTDLDEVLDGGTGLANVRERLHLFFDDAAEMHLQAQGVELWIPLDGATDVQPPVSPAPARSGPPPPG
ncbi:MAG: sensor histidine kinase, partial [Bacteroidetes bacterium QH_2_63_10]